MVRRCGNAKYLISYHTWDDDFDTDNGFCGKVQFCLGVRQPRIADPTEPNVMALISWSSLKG